MKLTLDHHYPKKLAVHLRDRGFDTITAVERAWHTESDEILLRLCSQEGRTLLTNDVSDFMPIIRQWQAQGLQHAGIIFTSDGTLPRTRESLGLYIAALEPFFILDESGEAWRNRVAWLTS